MAKKRVVVEKQGSVITVEVGKYRESFDTEFKNTSDIVSQVYWACYTGGVRMSFGTIENMLRANRVIP